MGEREQRIAQEIFMGQAWSGIYLFQLRSISQDILWPLQTEWRSGKCNLDVCSGMKKNGFGEQLAKFYHNSEKEWK